MTISVNGWIAGSFTVGVMIPIVLAALAGGYILGAAVLDRASKTVLGTHVRHFFTRLAPSKFFDKDFIDDRMFVERVVVEAIEAGRIELKRFSK